MTETPAADQAMDLQYRNFPAFDETAQANRKVLTDALEKFRPLVPVEFLESPPGNFGPVDTDLVIVPKEGTDGVDEVERFQGAGKRGEVRGHPSAEVATLTTLFSVTISSLKLRTRTSYLSYFSGTSSSWSR